MYIDELRASCRLCKKDVDKYLMVSNGEIDNFFQLANFQNVLVSDDVLHSGVHFDIGNFEEAHHLTKQLNPDDLIRHLNIMKIKLPYPRMTFSFSYSYVDKIPELSEKCDVDIDKLRAYLGEGMNFVLIVDSITDDLCFVTVWYTREPESKNLDKWGFHPYAYLISLYSEFKDRTLPSEKVFDNKGLSFINYYREKIEEADSNIVTLPIASEESIMDSSRVEITDEKEFMEKEKEMAEDHGSVVWEDDTTSSTDPMEADYIKSLYHKLWTKAVGTIGYDKTEWQRLQDLLLKRGIVT